VAKHDPSVPRASAVYLYMYTRLISNLPVHVDRCTTHAYASDLGAHPQGLLAPRRRTGHPLRSAHDTCGTFTCAVLERYTGYSWDSILSWVPSAASLW
jgi:hypothetical protein